MVVFAASEAASCAVMQVKAVDRKALAAINCYNPGLSAAWMFQRSMSVRPGQKTPRNFVNRLLGVNFKSMSRKGDWVLKPFLQVSMTVSVAVSHAGFELCHA